MKKTIRSNKEKKSNKGITGIIGGIIILTIGGTLPALYKVYEQSQYPKNKQDSVNVLYEDIGESNMTENMKKTRYAQLYTTLNYDRLKTDIEIFFGIWDNKSYKYASETLNMDEAVKAKFFQYDSYGDEVWVKKPTVTISNWGVDYEKIEEGIVKYTAEVFVTDGERSSNSQITISYLYNGKIVELNY